LIADFWEFVSSNPDTLAAVAGIGASVSALVAVILSVYSLAIQRQHNRLSVRPIANFGYVDFENEISIWLRNSGVGPMKIDALSTRCSDTDVVTTTLIEQMSQKSVKGSWTTFSGNLKGRTLRAGGVLHLIKLKGDHAEQDFCAQRDAARKALLSIELKITYSDIYGRTVGTEKRELSWFGRHFHDYDFGSRTLSRP
jgi:hypothetical protein